jgi:hypothetical protein
MLRDLVLSHEGELTQAQSAMLVQSLDEQERAFAAEGVDSRWANTTEAGILAAISGLTGLQLNTLQVDCKSSVCRLQFAERAGRSDFIARSGLEVRWMLSRVDPSGTRISVVYVGRDETASLTASYQ